LDIVEQQELNKVLENLQNSGSSGD